MGIAVYCVGSDAARVARALGGGSRRVSCTRLPLSVALVKRCVREAAPDLVVLGGEAWKASLVAEALADEPAADGAAVVAWGMDDEAGLARLIALGATAVPDDDEALARACSELLDARDGRTVRVDTEQDGEGFLHGKRVLVAEDDPAVAWYFGDTLRRAGCEVEEVHDGWEALDRARRMAPDVVLADIKMPGLDGLRLCRALRSDPILADVPVILMSWKADWLVRAREADAGATAYLGKHAVPQEVVERVSETLARHEDLRRRFATEGPVRGVLGDVSAHRLLRLACTLRPDCRLTVQAAAHAFEIHLRKGAPVSAARVSATGEELRGDEALGALLAVRSGRFVVAADRLAVKGELAGSLHQLAAPHVQQTRASGPRPAPTPSIPIVVEPTMTVKLAPPPDPSLPVPLVRKASGAAVILRPPPSPALVRAWRRLVRAVAAVGVAAMVVVLGADTRAQPDGAPVTAPLGAKAAPVVLRTPAATDEPDPVEPQGEVLPGARASRAPAPHPR
jgi:CheY-like chemotaxis protein